MKYNTHEQDLGNNKIQYQLSVLKQPLHADFHSLQQHGNRRGKANNNE